MTDNKIDQYAAFISSQIEKGDIKEARLDEMGKKGTFRPVSPGVQNVRTAQAATQGDKALDKEYHYGTTKGGVSPIAGKRKEQGFGSVANFNSAHAALTSKRMGGNSKAQDSAVHQGWGKTVDQMPAPNPEKQAARKKLQQTPFSALSKGEQEKDTVLRTGITKEEVKFSDEELEAINDIINEAEDNNSADFHKASFEYHAKKFLGHNAAMNSSRANDDLAYFDKHDAEESKHGAAAVHHAAAYHKITGKRIEMVILMFLLCYYKNNL